MDDIDRRLIGLLRENARLPVATLAQLLKVSRGTVQNRIDRLTADGVIGGFTVRLKPDAEPQRVRAITMVAVEGEHTAAVLKSLRGIPEVQALHTTNGRWDIIVELGVESLEAFGNAASHRSTAVCRPFTNGFTRAALKSLLSHVTSSATRSRGQTPRSPTSATRRMV